MNEATTSPAASGLVAKTPECIFTPVGTPRIGTRVAHGVDDVARRAVAAGEEDQVDARAAPSPPRPRACRPRSSPSRALGEHLGLERVLGGEIAAHRAARRDDAQPVAVRLEPRERPLGARGGDRHGAQLERPRARLAPVGSLQPDAAAHAGDRVDDQPEAPPSRQATAPQLGGDVVDGAAARSATISSISASVTTNGGENEIVSAAGSARVIRPSSRQRRVTRAPTLSAGSNGSRRILARPRTRPPRSVPRPADLADERMVVERPRGAARAGSAPRSAACAIRPSSLDQVEVRHRGGGRERVRRVGVAVAEGAALAEPSTSTRQTVSETMQPDSGHVRRGDALRDGDRGRARCRTPRRRTSGRAGRTPVITSSEIMQHVVAPEHLLDRARSSSRAERSRRPRPGPARR